MVKRKKIRVFPKPKKLQRVKGQKLLETAPLFSWNMDLAKQEVNYYSAWFVIIVLIAVLFILGLGNILGGLALIILGIAYFVFNHKSPSVLKISLYRRGLQIGNRYFNFSEILFFRIAKGQEKYRIILRTISRLNPDIIIEVPINVKEKLVKSLSKYLPRTNLYSSLFAL